MSDQTDQNQNQGNYNPDRDYQRSEVTPERANFAEVNDDDIGPGTHTGTVEVSDPAGQGPERDLLPGEQALRGQHDENAADPDAAQEDRLKAPVD